VVQERKSKERGEAGKIHRIKSGLSADSALEAARLLLAREGNSDCDHQLLFFLPAPGDLHPFLTSKSQ
jgi:hypothetical protein